jgi:hypothetical protein
MDLLIVYFWLIGLSVFVSLQIFYLRRISRYQALSWLGRVGASSSFLSAFVCALFIYDKYQSWLFATAGFVLVFILVMMSVVIYLLSIYSYIESSVTLKIFALIGAHSKQGLSYTQLLKLYGVSAVVKRRIDRFIALKIIDFDGRNFTSVEKMSAFVFREKFHQVFGKFFT